MPVVQDLYRGSLFRDTPTSQIDSTVPAVVVVVVVVMAAVMVVVVNNN